MAKIHIFPAVVMLGFGLAMVGSSHAQVADSTVRIHIRFSTKDAVSAQVSFRQDAAAGSPWIRSEMVKGDTDGVFVFESRDIIAHDDLHIVVNYPAKIDENNIEQKRQYSFRIRKITSDTPRVEASFYWLSPPAKTDAADKIRDDSSDVFQRYLSARTAAIRLLRGVYRGDTQLGRTIAELVSIWYRSYLDLEQIEVRSLESPSAIRNLSIPYDKELYRALKCFEKRGESSFLRKYVAGEQWKSEISEFYRRMDSKIGRKEGNWTGAACSDI